MSESPALQLWGVGKRYGVVRKRDALRGVSIRVERGECYGLAGPNGAGKTTLIRILLGLSAPDFGEVRLLGERPDNPETRRRVGFVPESAELPPSATPRQLVKRFARLRGLRDDREGLAQLDRLGVGSMLDRQAAKLSKGEKQRTLLALALMGEPELLVLDEPTDGLDPLGRALVRRIVREELERGRTVFLNSHLLSETERVCTRVGILNQGQLVREQLVSTEREDSGTSAVVLAAPPAPELVGATGARLAASLQGQVTEAGGATLLVDHADLAALNEKLDALRRGGALIAEVRRMGADLEATFESAVNGPAASVGTPAEPPAPAPITRRPFSRTVRAAIAVAQEIASDLAARRIGWIALGLAVLVLGFFLWVLRSEQLQGAAAFARSFGGDGSEVGHYIGRVGGAVAYWLLLCGSLVFSSFFAPPVLDPRRTMLLLAQPIARGDLATGIWIAVVAIALAVHAALVTMLFGGLRALEIAAPARLLLVPAASVLAFATIYALLLATQYLVRNAIVGSVVALGTLLLCMAAAEQRWRLVDALLPRVYILGRQAMRFGGGESISAQPFVVTGFFCVALLLVAQAIAKRSER